MRLLLPPLSFLSFSTLLPHSALVAAGGHGPASTDNAVRDGYDGNRTSYTLHEYAVARKLASKPVVGVKKMSDDEGEKFWPEYWYFGDEVENIGLNDTTGEQDRYEEGNSESYTWANNSEPLPYFFPSFPLHSDEQIGGAPYLIGRYLPAPRDLLSPLAKRAFQCPAGSHSCTSINRPSSCCGSGEICQLIQDTGLGDVGCCPQGQSCSGSVTTCGAGYSSCPSNPGGGCCIPGYECVNSGCKFCFLYGPGIATVTNPMQVLI